MAVCWLCVIEEYVKNSLQVAGGVVGAVVGFVATLLMLELVGFGNRADPITSGILALLVIAPLGAIAGLVLGTTLARRLRGGENTGRLLRNSLKALAVRRSRSASRPAPPTMSTPSRPRRPGSIRMPPTRFSSLRFACPPERHCRILPVTSPSNCRPTSTRMPGEPRFNQFRSDGDRPVIAGDVELAFRTAHRQLEIKVNGQPDRLYLIGLSAKAPHASELGPWQPNIDGSEIRYRARWPGQD